MGRAIDNLSAKLEAHSTVALAQVAGSMSNADSAARPAPFKAKPKPKPKPVARKATPQALHSTRQGVDNDYRKTESDGKDTGGGSDANFEKMHPRDKASGRFVYKEDTGKGAIGLGTKDKGLPTDKPDGQVHGRVSEAQQALVEAGFLKSTDGHQGQAIDGYLGRYTEAALRRYQQDKGLKVTGDIDEATAEALGLKKETGGTAAKKTAAPAKKTTMKAEPKDSQPVVGNGDPLESALSLLRDLLKKQRADVKLAADTSTVGLATFTESQRETLASKGAALPDGSYPIRNEQDLRNAISAYGRAKNKAAAKRHIIKRARALGLTNLLPEKWSSTVSLAGQEVVL